MITIELLTMIVLWCGTPTPYRLSVHDVNKCRDTLQECVNSATTKDAKLACFVRTKMIGE